MKKIEVGLELKCANLKIKHECCAKKANQIQNIFRILDARIINKT
jgi:hypothetical protein